MFFLSRSALKGYGDQIKKTEGRACKGEKKNEYTVRLHFMLISKYLILKYCDIKIIAMPYFMCKL
jgi:hypothetical protein